MEVKPFSVTEFSFLKVGGEWPVSCSDKELVYQVLQEHLPPLFQHMLTGSERAFMDGVVHHFTSENNLPYASFLLCSFAAALTYQAKYGEAMELYEAALYTCPENVCSFCIKAVLFLSCMMLMKGEERHEFIHGPLWSGSCLL